MIRARAIGLIATWLIAPNLAVANIDVVLEGVDGDVALNVQTMLTLYRFGMSKQRICRGSHLGKKL